MNLPINKGVLRRAGWASLALLFIVTGLGVGVYAFWVNTHPDNSSNNTAANQTSQSATCDSDLVDGQPVLPNPQAYKPGSKVTKLEVTDLEPGTGPAAGDGDCLVVKYYGTLASNGTFFDGNYDKPQGFKFKLGAGAVIKGWDQGLVGIKADGTRRLVIPASLAYGSQSPSPTIPPNSDLVFQVKLLKLN